MKDDLQYPVGTKVVCTEDGKSGVVTEVLAVSPGTGDFVWSIEDDDGTSWIAFEGDISILQEEEETEQ